MKSAKRGTFSSWPSRLGSTHPVFGLSPERKAVMQPLTRTFALGDAARFLGDATRAGAPEQTVNVSADHSGTYVTYARCRAMPWPN